MQMIVLFGLPGAGKTFVGKILESDFGLYFYDGDLSLPREMKLAIEKKVLISGQMRDKFFQKLLKKFSTLKYQKIVIAQTFIKEKHRQIFLKAFPETKFILVQTDTEIREARLIKRSDYPLDLDYARGMSVNFEVPKINYKMIDNNISGEESIRKQFQQYFAQPQT